MKYQLLRFLNKLYNFISTIHYKSAFFYEPKYKLRKIKWVIHLNDVDPSPSYPHMHSLDVKSLKMNV